MGIATFDIDHAKQAKFIERVPYSWMYAPLNVGLQPLFAVQNWGGGRLATLGPMAATQQANAALQIGYDKESANLTGSDAWPPNLEWTPSGFQAATSLKAVVNNTGAQQALWQFNYSVTMQTMTVADKLLRGIALTAPEQAIADKYGIADGVARGTFPVTTKRFIDERIRNRVTEEILVERDPSVSTTAPSEFFSITPGSDEVLVLRQVSMAPSTLANGVTLLGDRDGNPAWWSLYAYNGGLDTVNTFDFFLMADSVLNFYTLGAATVASEQVRLVIWRVKLSNVLRLRLGLTHRDDTPPRGMAVQQWQDLADRVQGGVI